MKKEVTIQMPEMNQRIKILVDEMAGGNVAEFVRMSKISSHQVLNRIFNISSVSKKYPEVSANILNAIKLNLPQVNYDWLLTGQGGKYLTGEGEMLKNQVPKEIEIGGGAVDSAFQKTNGSLYNLVPVYNFDAVGGLSASNDITDSPAYIERYIPFVGAKKDDFCVHVTGSSMMPTHCPGSILLVREVQNWREYFGYGHCYVIFLNDGRRILKEVRKFTENPKEYVLCVSHNKEYPDEELPKGMITAVYKVIMTLTNEGF